MTDKHVAGYIKHNDKARGRKMYQSVVDYYIIPDAYYSTATEALENAKKLVLDTIEKEDKNEPN